MSKKSAQIKKTVTSLEGRAPKAKEELAEGLISRDSMQESILEDLPSCVQELDAIRKGNPAKKRPAVDLSFTEYVKERFGFGSLESFYDAIDVDPSQCTIESLMNMGDMPDGYRWLVPEVIREAILLGLEQDPLYSELIVGEETVDNPEVTLPYVKESSATPSYIGEGESIPVGTVDFGQKKVSIRKLGTGLKLSDEVIRYVKLNLLSKYLTDAGRKLTAGLNTMAIDILINGDQAGGTEASAVIGVAAGSAFDYIDMLRVWLRMGRIGRLPSHIISNEGPALEIFELDEFKGFSGETTKQNLQLRTPVPRSQAYRVHGAMPATNQIMFVDNSAALIKLNATPILLENERIVNRQINASYMTVTTGFANMFRDARVILDKSLAYSGNPFPAWMDVDTVENITFSE